MNMKPQATVLLVAWGTLMAVIITLAMCGGGCQSVQQPITHYTLVQEHEQTVSITALCLDEADNSVHIMFGSGIRYNRTTVITAAHVAVPGKLNCVYSGAILGGEPQMLAPNHVDADRDLATLTTITGHFDGDDSPPVGDKPALGDTICEVAAFPYHVRRCGEVGLPHADMPHHIDSTMIVEPGNSGSPVYNVRGELIGITTNMWHCGNGQICGSLTASLDPDELHYLLTGVRL